MGKLPWIVGLGSVVAGSALAGTITLNGTSHIGKEADFIAISVDVSSECYPTYQAYQIATNGIANRIKETLTRFVDTAEGSRDQLIARPGFASRSTKTVYEPGTSVTRVVCRDGWHGANRIVLKIKNIAAFGDVQTAVLAIADALPNSAETPAKTEVTLSEPTPDLYPDVRQAATIEARNQALADASERFQEIVTKCGLVRPVITKIEENGRGTPIAYSNRAASRESGGSTFDPVFDLIYIHGDWSITWDFAARSHVCNVAL